MSQNGKSVRLPRAQIQSMPGHFAWVGVSAFLLLLVFPKPGWGILAHLALVPMMILAVRSASPKRMFLAAWAWSLLWWIIAIRWMFPVTGVGTVVLAMYLALYWPAAMLCVRYLDRKFHPAMTLSLPMVWTSLEFLRGYLIAGGFGWFALSHTQSDWRPDDAAGRIMQIADIFGEHGVTFIVCMTNGLIVDLLTRPWSRHDATGRPRTNRILRAAMLCWLSAMIGSTVYGEYRLRQMNDMQSPGPVVAVVQTNVPQNNKMSPDKEVIARDFQILLQLTREAADSDRNVELIIWPETVTPVPINPELVDDWFAAETYYKQQLEEGDIAVEEKLSRYTERLDYYRAVRGIAQETQVHLLAGSPSYIPREDDSIDQYNSVFYFTPDGVQSEKSYSKIHRVPFGEFVPYVENVPFLKRLFIKYLTPYDHDYSLRPGRRQTVFEIPYSIEESSESIGSDTQPAIPKTRIVRIATPICFEDTVPRLCRRLVYGNGQKRSDLLANLTNDGWFAGYWQSRQHLQAATFRCVENRVPMVRSVNTGVSAVIDSNGRVVSIVEGPDGRLETSGFLAERVNLDGRSTIFGRIGHIPVILLMLLTGILLVVGRFRRDKME